MNSPIDDSNEQVFKTSEIEIDDANEQILETSEIEIEEIEPPINRSAAPPPPPTARSKVPPPPSRPSIRKNESIEADTRKSVPYPDQKKKKHMTISAKPDPSTHSTSPPDDSLETAAFKRPKISIKPATGSIKPDISTNVTPKSTKSEKSEKELSESPRVKDAWNMIDACKQELKGKIDNLRAARLHYEIAELYEFTLGDVSNAKDHYQKACELQPDHIPAIQGTRRTLIKTQHYQACLNYFDAELPFTTQPKRRAQLLFDKGIVIEHYTKLYRKALDVYYEALRLDETNLLILRAISRCEFLEQNWDALEQVYSRIASTITDDPLYRAALTAERARIVDIRKHETSKATELYETSVALDPDAPGALEALKRLSYSQAKWLQLATSLEQEFSRSKDPVIRAAAQIQITRLQLEKLGNIGEGIAALENAIRETPNDKNLLKRLSVLYDQNDRTSDLVKCLERLYQVTQDIQERRTIAHRIGTINEDILKDETRAEYWYHQALMDDKGFFPALQSLEKHYERGCNWRALLNIYERELETKNDICDRAAIHCRIAQLLEVHLNEPTQAAEHYNQALTLVPDHEFALRALTQLYTQAKRFSALIEIYERMVDHSKSPQAAISYLFRIGSLYEDRLNDPAKAISAYQRILQLENKNLSAIQAEQRAASSAEKYEVLVIALEKEIELTEKGQAWAALLYRAAKVLDEHLKNTYAAIDKLRQVLDFDPENRLALIAIGRIYYRESRWEELLAVSKTELKVTPHGSQWVDLSYRIGELYETQLGRTKKAISRYKNTLKVAPEHSPSYHALYRLLYSSSAWTELAELIERRIEHEPDPHSKAYRYLELGELYEEKLEFSDKAINAYSKAIQEVATFRPAIEARARLLNKTQKFHRLSEVLIEESELISDPALKSDTLMRAASVQADFLEDNQAAIDTYESILKLNPNNLGALLALEGLYLKTRNYAALEKVYIQQINILSDSDTKMATLHDLAYLYQTSLQQDSKKLQNTYRMILDINLDDRTSLEVLAQNAHSDNDPKAVLVYEAKLAAISEQKQIAASHHCHIAAILEGTSTEQAMAAYRVSLALDPDSLTATRGLTRTAHSLGSADALSEAAQHEARTTRDKSVAIELLLQAAKQRHASGDIQHAVDDLEKILLLDPDHQPAAELITTMMIEINDIQRLAGILTNAADRTQNPERKARLYIELADLRANQLKNVPSAISAAERALTALPDYLPALQRLAAFLEQTKHWERAIDTYHRIVQRVKDDTVRISSLMRLATLTEEYFDDRQEAYKSLKAVLAVDSTNKTALKRLGNLYARDGEHMKALSIAERLVEASVRLSEKAVALTNVARINMVCNQPAKAVKALSQAIGIQGLEGNSADTYIEMIGEHATWQGYIESLEKYVERAHEKKLSGSSAIRAIADTQVKKLDSPERALKTLEKGIKYWPSDNGIWWDYAKRLNTLGRHKKAIEILCDRIQVDVTFSELWRELAKAYRLINNPEEALAAGQPLLLLNAASDEELVHLRSRQANPASMAPGLLDDTLIQRTQVDDALYSVLTSLVQNLSGTFSKLYPIDLKLYGLSRRSRIQPRSDHSMRVLADTIGDVVGAPDFDIYIHQNPSHDITVELTDPPSLMVPDWVTELSKPEIVFLLSRRIASIAQGLQAVDRLSINEMTIVLTAALINYLPGFSAPTINQNKLDDMARNLKKAISRRDRKLVENAVSHFRVSELPSIEGWMRDVHTTFSRIALLLSDDIVAGVKMVERTSYETLQENGIAADLVRFWISETAIQVRESIQ